MTSRSHILIAGCGDLGLAVGSALAAEGHLVTGLRRSAPALPNGIQAMQADVTRPETLADVHTLQPDVFVYCVAADAQTDDSYRMHYVEGLRNVLAALEGAPLRRVFFVSSTRVYGDDDGRWLDETSPAVPADFGGLRLREAEALLASRPATVLRLSGIYGPGRTRLIELARQPGKWPAHNNWTNRIHRDDAAAFITLLIRRTLTGKHVDDCYLVTDDSPTPQHEVLQWLVQRLGLPAAAQDIAPTGGKRLRNARMLETGFALRYPDYRAGYAALINSMQQQETESP